MAREFHRVESSPEANIAKGKPGGFPSGFPRDKWIPKGFSWPASESTGSAKKGLLNRIETPVCESNREVSGIHLLFSTIVGPTTDGPVLQRAAFSDEARPTGGSLPGRSCSRCACPDVPGSGKRCSNRESPFQNGSLKTEADRWMRRRESRLETASPGRRLGFPRGEWTREPPSAGPRSPNAIVGKGREESKGRCRTRPFGSGDLSSRESRKGNEDPARLKTTFQNARLIERKGGVKRRVFPTGNPKRRATPNSIDSTRKRWSIEREAREEPRKRLPQFLKSNEI